MESEFLRFKQASDTQVHCEMTYFSMKENDQYVKDKILMCISESFLHSLNLGECNFNTIFSSFIQKYL